MKNHIQNIKEFFQEKKTSTIKNLSALGLFSILILPQGPYEKFSNTTNNQEYTKGTGIEMEQTKIANMEELLAIQTTVNQMKSFNDFPLTIQYPESSKDKITNKQFPKTLDIWPKPTNEWRKDETGNRLETPDPLIIVLDNRKFTITPEIGSISKIIIQNGKIILDISKFGVIIKTEIYDSKRLTLLIIKIRNHTSGKGNDINETPRAIAIEL